MIGRGEFDTKQMAQIYLQTAKGKADVVRECQSLCVNHNFVGITYGLQIEICDQMDIPWALGSPFKFPC
jgi:hypothetical protein